MSSTISNIFKITFLFIGAIVGFLATYLSALGVYYKEPYFSVGETLLYASIAMISLYFLIRSWRKR
ncbi:MAG: hypothetical protein OA34_12355 [Sulfurospirillum sp. MES]|nr:MAG: hypothetical protein OA34_12355 [Sulfurospirillum sp. MES]